MKTHYQVSFLLLIALFLSGCAYDTLQQTQTLNPLDYKMAPVSWKEIKSHPEIMSEIQKSKRLRMPQSQAARSVYDENYGVFVDTTNIVMIEKDGKRTFTMSIINYDDDGKVENLILNSREDGGYAAYIAKYVLSDAEWAKLSNGENLPDKKPAEIKDISSYVRFTISGNGADCVRLSHYSQNLCDDANGNQMINNGELGNGCFNHYVSQNVTLVIVDLDCLSTDSGGSDGDGGIGGEGGWSPSPTGGGPVSGGGGTGDPVFVDPRNPSSSIYDPNNPIKTQLIPDQYRVFYKGLTPGQKSWWDNADNADHVKKLKAYMDEPAYNENTAKAIIDNETAGGDTDFENKIILDASFKNNQKANCVYSKMKTNHGFNTFTAPFNIDKPLAFVKLTAGVIDTGDRASTSPPDSNNIIVIKINSDPSSPNGIKAQPNMFLCQTIMHEVVHAEFFRRIIEAIGNGTYIQDYDIVVNALLNSKYSILADYIQHKEDWSHNYMAAQFRKAIARVTQEFNTNVPVTGDPMNIYMYYAWRGLDKFDVDAWMDIPQEARAGIQSQIDNYILNNANQSCN